MEEKNNYYCPDCGTKMIEVYEKPALNLTCPKCGCKMATTKWEEIDLDETQYEIISVSNNNPSVDKIKVISRVTGKNFVLAKSTLEKELLIFNGKARDVKVIAKILDDASITYEIKPDFNY